MAERFDEHNHYTISGWMLTEYNLKGTELLVFANIYSLTQDGTREFYGSLRYLSEGCGVSKQSVINALKSLVDAGYLIKGEYDDANGVRRTTYSAVKPCQKSLPGQSKNLTGVVKKFDRGSQNFLPKEESKNKVNQKENLEDHQERAREESHEEPKREENPFGGELDIPAVYNDTARVCKAYQNQIGQIPGGKAWELLCSYIADIGADAVIVGIEETNIMQPSNKWQYLKKLLDNFAERGVHDADSAKAAVNDHKSAANSARARDKPTANAQRDNYQQHRYTKADFGADFYFDPAKEYAGNDSS